MKLPATGSCQCGNVSYALKEQPLVTYACHCRDCQKLTTSSFSVTMLLKRTALEILSGDLKAWQRPAESGDTVKCWFCPNCGNRIYHENLGMPDFVRVKPGTLDDTSEIRPQLHVWTCREQGWLEDYAELPRVEKQPDLAAALQALAQGTSVADILESM